MFAPLNKVMTPFKFSWKRNVNIFLNGTGQAVYHPTGTNVFLGGRTFSPFYWWTVCQEQKHKVLRKREHFLKSGTETVELLRIVENRDKWERNRSGTKDLSQQKKQLSFSSKLSMKLSLLQNRTCSCSWWSAGKIRRAQKRTQGLKIPFS